MWGRTWLVSGARAKATLPSLAGPVGHFSLKRRGSPGVSPGGTPSRACPSPNPAPSLLRAMPKASTWQERTRGFANFVDFTAQSAKAASSSVTMATLWGAPPCHGKAAAGPVVPAVCCAAVLPRAALNFLEETQEPCFLSVPGCRRICDFIGCGGGRRRSQRETDIWALVPALSERPGDPDDGCGDRVLQRSRPTPRRWGPPRP